MGDRTFGILQKASGDTRPLNHHDVYEVTERILGLVASDIQKIQLHGPHRRRVYVKLYSRDIWYGRGIDRHIDRDYQLAAGKSVTIVQPFEDIDEVRVKRIPIIWDEQDVKRIFAFYGEVRSITEEQIKHGRDDREG